MRICPWLAVIVVVAIPLRGHAYEVKKSSTGAALHWEEAPELVLALAPDERTAATAAIATWNVGLAGTALALSSIDAGRDAVVTDGGDATNTVRWGDREDDPDLERGVLGLTFLSYATSTGEIRDADIVLNARNFAWTVDPSECTNEYDLQSALTHELGHLLGLAHSLGHHEAVMFATSDACETTKRTLAGDDRAGLDALYRTETTTTTDDGGCAAGGSPGIAMLLVALAGRRRRRAIVAGVVAVALGLVHPPGADAARLRHLAIAELAADAAVVVHGTVIATIARRDGGALVTDTLLAVERCAGERARCRDGLVVVRSRGGELGDEGLYVDAEARLALGAEIVVFLRADPRGRLRVLGGVQGQFDIVRRDGAVHAVRDLRGHDVLAHEAWDHGEREVVPASALGL